jgi:hypothetical protein
MAKVYGMPRCGRLCGRGARPLTRHHLIPRSQYQQRAVRPRFSQEEMTTWVVWLCLPRHGYVHAVFTERELASERNSVETLRAHPEIRRFVGWLAPKLMEFAPRVRAMKRSRRE